MRALLIINPRATSMSGRDAGLVVRALGSRLELDTRQTQYRGHAGKLATASAADGYDLVVTFSGDGTVNEVVNGLMQVPDGLERPVLAPIPGGSANVFARTLGLPPDAGSAVPRILASVERGTRRKIGLGLAGDRYFTFSAAWGSTRRSSPTWSGSGPAGGAPRRAPTCGPPSAGTTGTTAAAPP